MDAQLLDAEEVVAWCDARGDLYAVGFWRRKVSNCISGSDEQDLRDISHVPPGNFGPISLILNHGVLPSALLASSTLVI